MFFVSCINRESIYGNVDQKKDIHYNPLIIGLNEKIDFNRITPDYILDAVTYSINKAETIISNILLVHDSNRTFENTMLPLDNLYNVLFKIWNPCELLSSVSDDLEIRLACDKASLDFSNYLIDLSSNIRLYEAILAYSKGIDIAKLPNHRKRFLESELRDFKNSGMGLEKENRDKIKVIQNRIAELSIDFMNNINTYSDTIFIDKSLMDGLSDDFINERYIKDNLYALDLSYPTFYTYMKFAKSDSVRKLLRIKFLNRGMPDNPQILDEIIFLRNNYAEILGYLTYADLSITESMAGNVDSVWEFERKLLNNIKQKADQDTEQLLKIKNQINKSNDTLIYDWEKYYYESKLLEAKYNINENNIRQYFQLENVIQGMFDISQKLFGINYRQINNPSVWNKDVLMYEMWDSSTNTLLGMFYLDLFPRENKYQHAAEFNIISGKKIGLEYQLPVVCLVCNFSKNKPEKPSLLSHDEVETFFHEFGHLLHDLLSKTELASQSGTSVPMDFVETPSQVLENWTWDSESLKLFAKHYKTNEIIPDSLVDNMLLAKNIQSGNDLQQQIFYGMLDMKLYSKGNTDRDEETSLDILSELQNSITHYPYIEGTNQLASFDHLLDYSASYYGYLWSEVYSSDLFTEFESHGLMNKEIGMKFRNIILMPGGSKNPKMLVRSFLGREPNNKAFLNKKGIAQ